MHALEISDVTFPSPVFEEILIYKLSTIKSLKKEWFVNVTFLQKIKRNYPLDLKS